jgi:hypothetical protein
MTKKLRQSKFWRGYLAFNRLNPMINKYLFLHIMKTGGKSLMRLFEEQLGPDECLELTNFIWQQDPANSQLLSQYRMLSGHFGFHQLPPDYEDRYLITFLRDPVDRFISHYYYYRNDVNTNAHEEDLLAAKNMDFDAFVDYHATHEIWHVFNRQTFQLAGFVETNGVVSDRQLLQQAKRNLERFNFVGIYERFLESVYFLSCECGWPPVDELPKLNVTTNRVRMDTLDQALLERLRELNALDIQLYEHAIALYEGKKLDVLKLCMTRRHEQAQMSYDIQSTQPSTAPHRLASREFGSREIEILGGALKGLQWGCEEVMAGEEVMLSIFLLAHIDTENVTVGFRIEHEYGQIMFGTNTYYLKEDILVQKDSAHCLDFRFRMNLAEGHYRIIAAVHSGFRHTDRCFHWKNPLCNFRIAGHLDFYFDGIARLEPIVNARPVDLMTPLPLDQLNGVSLVIEDIKSRPTAGEIFHVKVKVKNGSSFLLASNPPWPVMLSYHWLDTATGNVIIFDGVRSCLISDFYPQTQHSNPMTVIAPPKKGSYILRVTLVQEQVAWFDSLPGSEVHTDGSVTVI